MTSDNPVQALLEQLKNEFISELPGRISEIERLILELKESDNYEEIYRLVHSLKGAGGTHGIQIISVICHQLENHLETQHSSGNQQSDLSIDHSLKYLDLLSKTHEQVAAQNYQFGHIEKRLNEISDASSPAPFTALVIESSKLQTDLIKQSLSHLPLSIHTSDNGLKALEELLHKKYDLVITSMEIAELNGEAVISAMRLSKGINKDTRSILLTSNTGKQPNRYSDPDLIVSRSTQFSSELAKTAEQLLKN